MDDPFAFEPLDVNAVMESEVAERPCRTTDEEGQFVDEPATG